VIDRLPFLPLSPQAFIFAPSFLNSPVLSELKVTSILDKIANYKIEWIQHVDRMTRCILPSLLKICAPRGTINQGKALKRLLHK
jgi:hypothetical protein